MTLTYKNNRDGLILMQKASLNKNTFSQIIKWFIALSVPLIIVFLAYYSITLKGFRLWVPLVAIGLISLWVIFVLKSFNTLVLKFSSVIINKKHEEICRLSISEHRFHYFDSHDDIVSDRIKGFNEDKDLLNIHVSGDLFVQIPLDCIKGEDSESLTFYLSRLRDR